MAPLYAKISVFTIWKKYVFGDCKVLVLSATSSLLRVDFCAFYSVLMGVPAMLVPAWLHGQLSHVLTNAWSKSLRLVWPAGVKRCSHSGVHATSGICACPRKWMN